MSDVYLLIYAVFMLEKPDHYYILHSMHYNLSHNRTLHVYVIHSLTIIYDIIFIIIHVFTNVNNCYKKTFLQCLLTLPLSRRTDGPATETKKRDDVFGPEFHPRLEKLSKNPLKPFYNAF